MRGHRAIAVTSFGNMKDYLEKINNSLLALLRTYSILSYILP